MKDKKWRSLMSNPRDEQEIVAIVGVCREDDPADVDEAYGQGTYARLFPLTECPHCEEDYFVGDLHMCRDTQENPND